MVGKLSIMKVCWSLYVNVLIIWYFHCAVKKMGFVEVMFWLLGAPSVSLEYSQRGIGLVLALKCYNQWQWICNYSVSLSLNIQEMRECYYHGCNLTLTLDDIAEFTLCAIAFIKFNVSQDAEKVPLSPEITSNSSDLSECVSGLI